MKIHNKGLMKSGAVLFSICFCLLFFTSRIQQNYLFTPLILGVILMIVAIKKPRKIKE